MLDIRKNNDSICIKAAKYQLDLNLDKGIAFLKISDGGELFGFPLDVQIQQHGESIQVSKPLHSEIKGQKVTLKAILPAKPFSSQILSFEFFDDCFEFSCRATVAGGCQIKPANIEYFRGHELGIDLNHLIEGFTYPEWGLCEENYRDIFPTAKLGGLATPSILNIGIKVYNGFVGIGLMTMSNAATFGLSRPALGLAVDALGGNILLKENQEYIGPTVVFTFPADGWSGITEFRGKLQAKGLIPAQSLSDNPQWWKRPTYCTYGDQIMELQPALYSDKYWDVEGYNQQWVKDAVLRAEEKLGYKDFTVCIDAFWQKRYDTDPIGDPKRFPDMRGLVDWLHGRGHKVLLWYAPHAVCLTNEAGKIARSFGMLDNTVTFPSLEPLAVLDYSSSNAKPYLEEISRRFFSDDNDCLNADGLKTDFLFFIPKPEDCTFKYSNPENGMGFKFAVRYLDLFHSAATSVKKDVLINYSANDPRLANLFGINRLHDTRLFPLERERRAKFSAMACPQLLIDSDGAIMMSDWVEHTYISSAVYSTPSLYYIDKFNDGQRLPDKTMRALGRLFEICQERFWGVPEFINYGCWQSRGCNGSVVGESYDGKFCWLQTGENLIKAICLTEQKRKICLHGKRIKTIEPKPAELIVAGDAVEALWDGGITYNIALL